MTKIVALAGSTRVESFNKKLLKVASEGATQAGAQILTIDLKDYPLPLFDEDIERANGLPENVIKLKKIFREHQGFLFALPEYNGSFSGVFKNTLDWISRPMEGESVLECFKDKTAALLSASPGKLGGIRGLVHARALLQNINVLVIPEQVCVGMAAEAFNQDGTLKDEKIKKSVEKIGAKLVQITKKINSTASF